MLTQSDTQNDPPTAVPVNPPAATPPPPAGPPPAAPQPVDHPPSAPTGNEGKVITLPLRALKGRIDVATASGRKAYQAELDEQARAKGFASHEAMMAHLDSVLGKGPPKAGAKPPAPTPDPNNRPRPPSNPSDRKEVARYQRELAQWQKQVDALRAKAADEAKKRRKAERRAEAAEARAALERIAASVGIVKIGQAIYLYQEACREKTEQELGQMDERKFFSDLKQTDPYLFGEITVPATTGTSGAPPGARTPAPGSVGRAAGASGKVNAVEMSKEEWAAYKRDRRLTSNARGLA